MKNMRIARLLIFLLVFGLLVQDSFALSYQKLNSLIPSEAKERDNLGVYIKSLKTGKDVFSFNGRKNFIPASNNKIISSFVALSLLGKDFRFRTEFYSGGVLQNGVLHGGLYVKGYGDPTIKVEQIKAMADRLSSMGVRKIKGGIYLDDSYYDELKYAEGWKDKWVGLHYCPPVGPFILNYNNMDLHIIPGNLGKPASFKTFPENTAFEIQNGTTTTRNTAAVSTQFTDDGKKLKVSGSVSTSRGEELVTISVLDPLVFFGSVLRNTLIENGIEVEGSLYRDKVPVWSNDLFTAYSKPLEEIIHEYNKESINIIGESLVKTLGAVYVNEPGTWKDGITVIKGFLRKIGIDQEMTLADGSGLSVLNHVSPDVLARILSVAYKDPDISRVFIESLPVAGVDGTLEKRFRGSKIQGRVFAKTGYLSGVRSLSGYAKADNGEVYVFSIISNGLGWKARQFQEEVLLELVN